MRVNLVFNRLRKVKNELNSSCFWTNANKKLQD